MSTNQYTTRRDLPEKHVAYYLWRYPMLSETFIQREIQALKQSGFPIEIIADAPGDLDVLSTDVRILVKDTHYLFPLKKYQFLISILSFFVKNPFVFLKHFLYVARQQYHSQKTIKMDLLIFLKALYLAGILRKLKIHHVHSPWADVNAFILLVAAKVLQISYTLQARAHDIHREACKYGLVEKFEHAEFIITNTQYNKRHLQSLLKQQHWGKIHVIYNGIQLEQFQPDSRTEHLSEPIAIICVARLIEQKGLVILLKVCKRLQDKGYKFKCDIIGGPELPLYLEYYTKLQYLHKQLGLEDSVEFLGAQPFHKVIEAYKKGDIFVLPSVIAEDGSRDIIPNCVIEAMAMKLAVLSTTVTGIPEIVEHGVSGILVPPNDEHALGENLIRLIEDPSLRVTLGENARKKIEMQFDIQKNILHYIHLFCYGLRKPIDHGN